MLVCPECRQQFPPGAKFCPNDGQELEEVVLLPDDEDRFLGMLLDDRYQIEYRLGQGGMGVVYAARHVVIDKPVAVKILRHEYCRDKGLVQRFIREARAASRIGHPNIVDVTDFGRLEDGHIYFVMEYLLGTTLAQAVRGSRGLRMLRVLDLGVQICHGLAAAHAKGIVHRDLKPENIFIVNPCNQTMIEDQTGQRQDFVKLLDFGIAKFNFGNKTRITRLGSVFGTPQYMSPEQAAGEDADHRGDIYSMGCILYEMVTGEVPFTSDTFMGTLTKQMFEPPLAPRQLRPDLRIPRPLEAVILKTLAKDPAQRYQSMQEIAHLLDACMDDPSVRTGGPRVAPGDREERGTSPPGETHIDLRSTGRGADAASDMIEDLSVVEHPDEAPRERERRHEPTEAVKQLPRPGGTSIGWVALAALLVVGLLITGMLLWRRSVAERKRSRELAAAGQTRRLDAGAMKPDTMSLLRLTLNTIPQGAEVWYGERLLGTTQLTADLPVGVPLKLTFRLSNYRALSKTVQVQASDPRLLTFRLEEKPAAKVKRRRRLRRPNVSKKDLRDPFGRKN
ncbi:MAG: hypothetical protein CSB49_06880 [Proteobacteria bacterium]|nr:MAG: hypothetical protein CSB49_06880 [Pseudomonadota bacterium]